jgi:uncharacterized membrane protein
MSLRELLNKNKIFYLILLIIVVIGAGLRFINIQYSSLWADELYSMLSVHPDNSWYEILYMQRTYQPPGYFMLLWVWTKVFAYNDFYARLLSVLAGVATIPLAAYLGYLFRGRKLAIFMAFMTAFNPALIWNSLEARFYIFTFLLATLSLVLYAFNLLQGKRSWFFYLFKSGVDAALVYFHHFGILLLTGQFIYDLVLLKRDKDSRLFVSKLLSYMLAALFYLPWVFFGLLEGLSIKQYWLKEIDVYAYVTYSFGYNIWLNSVAILLAFFCVYNQVRQKKTEWILFTAVIAIVLLTPLVYSYIRIPLLVDRYSIVMGPVLYLMTGYGVIDIVNNKYLYNKALLIKLVFATSLVIYSASGLYMSLVDKSRLVKQPWREMAAWLKKRKDYQQIPVFAQGKQLKDKFTIDYYLEQPKKAQHFNTLHIGAEPIFYLVETNSVWKIKDSSMAKIHQLYNVETFDFQENSVDFGRVYFCKLKEH